MGEFLMLGLQDTPDRNSIFNIVQNTILVQAQIFQAEAGALEAAQVSCSNVSVSENAYCNINQLNNLQQAHFIYTPCMILLAYSYQCRFPSYFALRTESLLFLAIRPFGSNFHTCSAFLLLWPSE